MGNSRHLSLGEMRFHPASGARKKTPSREASAPQCSACNVQHLFTDLIAKASTALTHRHTKRRLNRPTR